MATIDLVPSTQSISLPGDGDATAVAFTPKSSSGTGVNLTGAAFALLTYPSGTSADSAFAIAGTAPTIVSASAGALVLNMVGAANLPSNFNYAIKVTPSGGTAQLLAQGTMRST